MRGKPLSKVLLQVEPYTGKIVNIYLSIRYAADVNNYNYKSMCFCVAAGQKYKGYMWTWSNDKTHIKKCIYELIDKI